jgi:hypothetical protein
MRVIIDCQTNTIAIGILRAMCMSKMGAYAKIENN